MDDLISRQAAIDAILAVTGNSSVRELYEHVQEHELSDMWSGGVNAAIDIIIAVPSVQPETHEKRTETHGVCLDTISRQAAIDVLDKNHILGRGDLNEVLDHIVDRLEKLPPAQPEHTSNNDCNGCKFVGCYDTDFPCANCIRKNKDYYAPERRTDGN